jgi:hypothetical protein
MTWASEEKRLPAQPRPPLAAADFLALCVLAALAIALFRLHIFGFGTYLGNPDRLNSNLKILKYNVECLESGRLDAWNDYEMMGYDTFTMPYTFPNPLTGLTWALGLKNLYITSGFVSAVLLMLAGGAAYIFLRLLTGTRLPALIGALTYQFSALTILKVSQNDMSFAVFIIMPLLAAAVWHVDRRRAALSFLVLSLLIFAMLQFMFLQKAAYALMLTGSYACYRTIRQRDWRPAGVFSAAVVVGSLAAFPRLAGIASVMAEYARFTPGHNFRNFEDLYHFQRIRPIQALRWFDDTIFGRTPAECFIRNNVSMTEGALVYTSALTPFVLLLGLVRYRGRWLGLARAREADLCFFCGFFLFAWAVLAVKPVQQVVWLLFLKLDFTHARILLAGLLAQSVLVAGMLAVLRPASVTVLRGKQIVLTWIGAAAVALLVIWQIEEVAQQMPGSWKLPFDHKLSVSREAVCRVLLSGVVVIVLLALLRGVRRRPLAAGVCFGALCLVLTGQTLLAADFRVNGDHVQDQTFPFFCGNSYLAERTAFAVPEAGEVQALHERLAPDRYRVVMLCHPCVAGGFGAAHVPEFWRLRAIDGYYGLGVPARLAAFDWPSGHSLRALSFHDTDKLPWPLLGLLNVKHALVVDRFLYLHEADPQATEQTVQIIPNPERVLPRCFFARKVEPVASAKEAADRLLPDGQAMDAQDCSFVENFPAARSFEADDPVTWQGGGDCLEIRVAAAPHERFLVVNDLYFPGWQATVDGRPIPIYPTNAVMRGIVVPAQATQVTLHYVPFVRRPWAWTFPSAGLALLLVGLVLFRRAEPGLEAAGSSQVAKRASGSLPPCGGGLGWGVASVLRSSRHSHCKTGTAHPTLPRSDPPPPLSLTRGEGANRAETREPCQAPGPAPLRTTGAALVTWERWLALVLGLALLGAVAWQFLFQVTYAATMIEYHFKYLPCLLDGGLGAVWDFNGLGDPRPRLVNNVLTLINIQLRQWLMSSMVLHPAFGLNWFLYPLCLLLLYRVVVRLTDSPRTAVMSVLLYAASPALLDTLTHYYLPAKPVINFLVLAALYGACLMFPGAAATWRPRVKSGMAIVFGASLLALLSDETAVFILLCLPVIFWTPLRSPQVQRSSKALFATALMSACLVFLLLTFLIFPVLNESCAQVPLNFWQTALNGPYQAMFELTPIPLENLRHRWSPMILAETMLSVHAVPNRSLHSAWINHKGTPHCYRWPWTEQLFFYSAATTLLVLLRSCARGRPAEWSLARRLATACGLFILVEAALVLRLQPEIVETNYYAALASLFFALLVGVLLGRLVSPAARAFSWALVGYLLVVQFTNYVATAAGHPYIDQPPLTWDDLRTVHAQVAEGNFATVARSYTFPSRRFLYAFECQAGRDHAAGRRVDIRPAGAAGDNLLQAIPLDAYADPSVRYWQLFASMRREEDIRLFHFDQVDGKDLAHLLAGKVLAGRSDDWGYLRTIARDGSIRQRFWREGLMRVWADSGFMHAADGEVRLAFRQMREETLSRIYHYQGVYYAYGPEGDLVTLFTIK